jgi:hypothetical protein
MLPMVEFPQIVQHYALREQCALLPKLGLDYLLLLTFLALTGRCKSRVMRALIIASNVKLSLHQQSNSPYRHST